MTGIRSAVTSTAAPAAVRGFVHQLFATRVVFAAGARHRLPDEVARLGVRRVLLIGGAPPLDDVADELAAALGSTVAARIVDVAQHVPADTADAAVATARSAAVEAVAVIGGGSATGLAKIVALETGVPVIAVPTTYAGSEMTDIWGRTDGGRKRTGRHPRVRPQVVIYDVELTSGMPAALTAGSGLNALAHCVEAAYDADASPVTRLLAVEGARALAAALPVAVMHGDNDAARAELLYGAWLAGTALGTAQMGVHHRLCHILGGSFGLPHAETHAAVLPHAIAFNQTAAAAELAAVATALNAAPGDAAGAAWDLARRIGAPASLIELGLSRADAAQAVELLVAHPGPNPRPVDPEGARQLVLAAHAGHRPEP